MEWMWLIYWFIMLSSFVIGFVYFFKSKQQRWLGFLQSIMTLIIVAWAFLFAFKRDYTIYSEIEFLLIKLSNGSLEAILLVVSYIILLIIYIRNMVVLLKK